MNQDQKVETPTEETAIVAAKPDAIAPVSFDSLLERYKEVPTFIKTYGQRILGAERDYKDPDEILDMIDTLSDDLPQKEALYDVLKRLQPEKKGIISDRAQSFHTDLRIFQGIGNDPNIPQGLPPGNMYLSSGEKVGAEFIGTPIALWAGQELVEKTDGGATSTTLCYSNDRKFGNYYGECAACQYFPVWRPNAPKTPLYCQKFVHAFLLAKSGKEIVLIRFNRSSSSAGHQLLKFASRTSQPWSRWYSIKTVVKVHPKKPTQRWYVYEATVSSEEDRNVSKELFPICDALCTAASRDYVLPIIGRCYADAINDAATGGSSAADIEVVTPETDTGFGYGELNSDLAEDA